jgi:hypothetical protein
MPPSPEATVIPSWLLFLVIGFVLLLFWLISATAASAAAVFIGFVAAASAWSNYRMRCIGAGRTGESICTFARTFNLRVVDPWIVRAVYEEIQAQFGKSVPQFPVRATDHLAQDLGIVNEDLDALAEDVAYRSKRSLAAPEQNPIKKIETVADLVFFLHHHQPRGSAA